jgi:hypothetical protein
MLSRWLIEELGSGSIADYVTLPERYLWAKIAVAAGAPRGETDYISLPKNYAWSDIYNAISGDIAQSTVVVSGLSDTQYNGRYVYDGNLDGRPSYRLDENVSIFWFENNVWVLVDTDSVLSMSSVSDVAYPWLATGWVDEGIDPTGLVLTAETPNHTDWSEKQALGHIAAAYRGDTANPANLATYIDWPWRYQVASIITSLLVPPEPACDNATAQVLMTGWVFGDRTLSPIGYLPYGKETYTFGDEVVRYETGVWIYENSGLGEITRAYSYADYPWLAIWDSPFTSSKICP